MDAKEIAARSAVGTIAHGMVLGLGSGSTSLRAVHVLAERIRKEGLDVVGVPTSAATEREARALGVPLTTLDEKQELDLAIDGADQVDERLACIKGYGGALVREKIVARSARRFLVMVDASKLAPVLDKRVPVEVLPFAWAVAWRGLVNLGGHPHMRRADGEPYVTDNGNYTLDVDFGRIAEPGALAARIAAVPGVIDHGLFVDLVTELHVGEPQGARVLRRRASDPAAAILAMERAALDRWCRGDPSGFLEISAPDVVYFDPFLDRRLDGRDALARYYESLRGKVQVERYELLDPKVQIEGEAAVLTFNYVSRGGEAPNRWNCTEVYRRHGTGWHIVQTHWSLTQPKS
jgi:ribose 5-phosphate isomerase A